MSQLSTNEPEPGTPAPAAPPITDAPSAASTPAGSPSPPRESSPSFQGNEGPPPSAESPAPDEELPANVREYLSKNPTHKDIVALLNREFQTSFTPRLQEAAEIRKWKESLPRDVVALNEHLVQSYERDPSGQDAFRILQQITQAQGAAPQAPPPSATNPYGPPAQPQPQFDAYGNPLASAHESSSSFQYDDPVVQRLAALEQQNQQFRQQQIETQIQSEFGQLEAKYGQPIPLLERRALVDWGIRNGMPSVTHAYEAFNRDRLWAAREVKLREELSRVQTAKAEAGPPPSTVAHRAPDQPDLPADLHTGIAAIAHQIMNR